jgi:hypothetical protein
MLSMMETIQIRLQKDLDDSFAAITKTTSTETDATNSSHTVKKYTNDVFVLPIHTIEDKSTVHELCPSIASDLELVSTTNTDENMNMYSYLFDLPCENDGTSNESDTFRGNNLFATDLIPQWQTHFTSNVAFLQDSQTIIHRMPRISPRVCCTVSSEQLKKNWEAVKHDPRFCEHYGYLEWDMLKEFNQSSTFLQALSIAHILSPLMSFFIPFLFLLLPFILLKFQGVPITFVVYIDVLKTIAKNHFIGKAIIGMENFSIMNLLYLLFMLGLYLLQMYQNTVQCIRFYQNVQKVNNELCQWKEFCEYSVSNMDAFLEETKDLETYKMFRLQVSHHRIQLTAVNQMLQNVFAFQCNWRKSAEIGYMLQCYYELHINENFAESILFSMGFDGYIHLMGGLYKNVKEGHLNMADFVKETQQDTVQESNNTEESENVSDKPDTDMDTDTEMETETETENKIDNESSESTVIKQQYYPVHMYDTNLVKNDACLASNLVITGPNASGKTTFLKSTAINVLFSQQVGVGFYKSCKINPYHHMHSYLNIPDTSGRDSLFQAESRRCKDIISCIQTKGSEERHFCIFDELYSGTNPKEATKAAYAFMEYIRSFSNVDLLLTTHYASICERWSEDSTKRSIMNHQMEVIDVVEEDTSVQKMLCTFKMISGISNREGAIRILEEMDYPKEMIEMVANQDEPKENSSQPVEESEDVVL